MLTTRRARAQCIVHCVIMSNNEDESDGLLEITAQSPEKRIRLRTRSDASSNESNESNGSGQSIWFKQPNSSASTEGEFESKSYSATAHGVCDAACQSMCSTGRCIDHHALVGLIENCIEKNEEFRENLIRFPQWLQKSGYEHADIDAAVERASSVIERAIDEYRSFKIGITEKPAERIERYINGTHGGYWSSMNVVHVACNGRKIEDPDRARLCCTTGNLEDALIEKWRGNHLCMNKGPGAVGATKGNPNFCYVMTSSPGAMPGKGNSDDYPAGFQSVQDELRQQYPGLQYR